MVTVAVVTYDHNVTVYNNHPIIQKPVSFSYLLPASDVIIPFTNVDSETCFKEAWTQTVYVHSRTTTAHRTVLRSLTRAYRIYTWYHKADALQNAQMSYRDVDSELVLRVMTRRTMFTEVLP